MARLSRIRKSWAQLITPNDPRISLADETWNGTPCWRWAGAHGKKHGRATIGKRLIYRELYRSEREPIRRGMHLHHGCERDWCINPWHLEQLTPKQHRASHPLAGVAAIAAAQDCCVHGHPFDLINTRLYTNPNSGKTQRACRACDNARSLARYHQRRHHDLKAA